MLEQPGAPVQRDHHGARGPLQGAGEPGSPRIRIGVQRCRDRSICISGPWLSSRTTQSRVVDYH